MILNPEVIFFQVVCQLQIRYCQIHRSQSHTSTPPPRPNTHSLVDGDLGGDLGPEAGVAHGHHCLLGLAVHVHVQHEAAEGGAQVVGQAVVKHAAQDQVHGQLAGHLVDGQVLAVQTHLGKQVELVSGGGRGGGNTRKRGVIGVS